MRRGKLLKKLLVRGQTLHVLLGLAFFVVVSMFVTLPVYSQRQHSKPEATDESVEKRSRTSLIQTDAYQLSIEKSLSFKEGECCQIKVTLTSNTKEEMYYEWGFDMDEFRIKIEDRKGKIVPLSGNAPGNAVPKSGSHYLVRLAPKEKHDFDLDLSYFYNLDAGKYKLFISRPVLGKDKVTVFTAKLKPTEISITK